MATAAAVAHCALTMACRHRRSATDRCDERADCVECLHVKLSDRNDKEREPVGVSERCGVPGSSFNSDAFGMCSSPLTSVRMEAVTEIFKRE